MNTDERRQFSERLAEAMKAAGYEAQPSVLEKLFNSRYRGRSVAFATASRWLNGKMIPGQDKLKVLAKLFGVAPHVLRYGNEATKIAVPRAAWQSGIHPLDREMIEAYLALPAARRKLVRELVTALRA